VQPREALLPSIYQGAFVSLFKRWTGCLLVRQIVEPDSLTNRSICEEVNQLINVETFFKLNKEIKP